MPSENPNSAYRVPSAFELRQKIEQAHIKNEMIGLTANNELITQATFNHRKVRNLTYDLTFSSCLSRLRDALDKAGVPDTAVTNRAIKDELNSVLYAKTVNTSSKVRLSNQKDNELYHHALAGDCGSLTNKEIKTAIQLEKLFPFEHQRLRRHIEIMNEGKQAVSFPEKLADLVKREILEGTLCVEARNINSLTESGTRKLHKSELYTVLDNLRKLSSSQYPLFAAQAATYVAKSIQSLPHNDPRWVEFKNR